jgi:hypothetical protein
MRLPDCQLNKHAKTDPRIHTRLAINEPSFKSHQFDLSSPDAHWKKDQGASSCDDLFLKRSFDVRGSLNLYLDLR